MQGGWNAGGRGSPEYPDALALFLVDEDFFAAALGRTP